MMNYAKAKRSPWEAERQAQENGTLTVQPQVINYSNQLIKGNRSSNMSKVITELYAHKLFVPEICVFERKARSSYIQMHDELEAVIMNTGSTHGEMCHLLWDFRQSESILWQDTLDFVRKKDKQRYGN